MKFTAPVKALIQAAKTPHGVAINRSETESFLQGLICLRAGLPGLGLRARGHTAASVVWVRRRDGYSCIAKGTALVSAKEFLKALQSFGSGEKIIVRATARRVTVATESGSESHCVENMQNLPFTPTCTAKCAKRIVLRRGDLLNGLKSVKFAMAKYAMMSGYRCIRIEAASGMLRFTAGRGSLFATYAITAPDNLDPSSNIDLLLPHNNINDLVRILNCAEDDSITLEYHERNAKLGTLEQIRVKSKTQRLILLGPEEYTRYPDVNKALEQDYPYQITTHIEDWQQVVKAIEEEEPGWLKLYRVRITVYPVEGHFVINSDKANTWQLKVPFAMGRCKYDQVKGLDHLPWVATYAENIVEMVKRGKKYDKCLIKFYDQSDIEECSSGDRSSKSVRPILIDYLEKSQPDEATEQFKIFFTTTSKW